MNRREFLQLAGAAATACGLERRPPGLAGSDPSTFVLRIAPVAVELAPGKVVHTVGCNGHAPGPLLRVHEGVPIEIDVSNDTNQPRLVQWYGLHAGFSEDGPREQTCPVIAPGERRRYKLVPKPSGTRWYRASTMAGTQPGYASAAGPFGFLYVEPRRERGDYDRELFLAIRQWEPISGKHGEIEAKVSRPEYRYASFNDKLLGAGEPIRVREGERVLFRFLNAGPGQDITLSLPGHRFAVIALDGNPVPNPCCVEVLSLAVGERVDAMVEMMHPGKWVLGSLSHAERRKGLGIVVEYANRVGQANWSMPQARGWSYALFAASDKSNSRSEETIELMLERQAKGEGGSDHLSINGKPLSGMDPLQLSPGVGYRLRLLNATEHPHTMHLPHQTFEIVRLNQFSIAGIWKDTVRLERYGAMDANFIADKAAPFLPEFLGQGHTQQEEMPMVRM